MSIDWSKAPEGATHWEPTGPECHEGWMKKEGDYWFYWVEGINKWCHGPSCNVSAERAATFEARPQEAWGGQGLPPVGTVCEYYADENTWRSCEIVAHKDGQAVVWANNVHIWASSGASLRPIRTPEQIAAEEREKAINQMISDAGYVDPKIGTFVAMGNLYDAGYRRQESST
ncbi:TPA: hypothetical protein L4G29_005636 [Pseudomonas aeruginosa]|nr:hypothetical protein [Pseudomonas aeruginosa]